MDYNVSHFRSCYIEYNQGQTKWKIKTTPSPILMMKNCVFQLWQNLLLGRVNGWFYFSCYSVQDCSLLRKLIKVVSSLK